MHGLEELCLTYESRGKKREANGKRRNVAMARLGHSSGKDHLQPIRYTLSATKQQWPRGG